MNRDKATTVRPLHIFSREKIEEFSVMSTHARLCWLEEANILASKILGTERRAQSDERFRRLPEH